MKYVALVRGVGPSNPNQSNANLKRVCEDLGYASVEPVISSGNVIFETDSADADALEKELEEAWRVELGFDRVTIVRSQTDLERMAGMRPFGDREHGPTTYLLTTFARSPLDLEFDFPYRPQGREYLLVGATQREVFSVIDNTNPATTSLMSWLEKQFGNEITSRTWPTVTRILKRMG